MHLFCKTDEAILLLGCESEIGPMRFPSESQDLPGLRIKVDPRMPITEQLLAKAAEYIGIEKVKRHVDIVQEHCETFAIEGGKEITLFVGTMHFRHRVAQHSWATMPDLLKAMPKNRTRLPYLKAWQVLTGALTANVKAVDLEEALKHLAKDES